MRAALIYGILIQICLGYRYAWRPSTKVFPYEKFPEPSVIDNGDNDGEFIPEEVFFQVIPDPTILCITVWLGNGACNRENNKAECNWDGGDCCRKSCIDNCSKKAANATSTSKCKFECGSFNGYECKQPNQGCQICGKNGICLSQEQCLFNNSNSLLGNATDVFNRMIDYCWSIDWSQGNYQTIDSYCGKDPLKQVIHDPVHPTLHFYGCGVPSTQCTAYPACDYVMKYKFRSQPAVRSDYHPCTFEVKSYELYDRAYKVARNVSTSCQAYFTQAFIENYKYYGQCCQCTQGWTGIDCTQAVCYPKCQNGICVEPNVCQCEPGWQGLVCQIGICQKCYYGVCTAPEVCECFYGYEGPHCDIPVSLPPCHHGIATQPDTCKCDEGWEGRICDRPICDPDCGEQGHCMQPNVCECDIGWESSNRLTPCDITNPILHDPNCVEAAVNEHCTACDYEFYLDPIDFTCHRCNQVYDQMCFECDHNQCLECQWPYIVDQKTSQCFSGGVIEFTNTYLDVIEDQLFFWVYLRRSFGQNGTVSVRYDMTTPEPKNERIQKRQGTLVFYEGQEIASIQFDIFKRLRFESASNQTMMPTEDTVFTIWIEYPSINAEIGYRDKMTIHYFDSPLLTDSYWTQCKYLNYTANSTTTMQMPTLVLGEFYTIDLYAQYLDGINKTDGSELYYLIVRSETGKQLREVNKSVWIKDNHHQITFPVYDLSVRFVHVYSSAPQGYRVRYHDNINYYGAPVLQRIENFLPVILAEQPMKRYDKYAVNYTFVAEFNTTAFPLEEQFTFYVNIAENSLAQIYLNDTLIIDIPMQECTGKYYSDGSSCCNQSYNHSRPMSGNITFQFRIMYQQRQPAFNGPCIKFTRKATNLPLDSIDREARAIVQLENSPFNFETKITPDFISANYSSFTYYPNINPNNGLIVSQNQFQVCVNNLFIFDIRDQFGVIVNDLPELQANFTFTIGSTIITKNTTFNVTDSRRYVTLYYCGPTGNATLRVTLKGDETNGSPRNFTVIAGPWNLTQSDISEWNNKTGGCQAHQICLVQLVLRDRVYNYIDVPGIFNHDRDPDFQLTALNSNNSEYFTSFNESKTLHYEIYPQFIPREPGPHLFYIRFKGLKVKVYPIQIEVYSTRADSVNSYIVEQNINPMRVCGIPLIFHVQLCDQNNHKLTASKYLFDVRLQSQQNPSQVILQTAVDQVDISLYKVEIITQTSGWYKMTITVTNQQWGYQVQLFTMILDQQYWQSYLASFTYSTAQGSAIYEVYTVSTESFAVQIRDPYQNKFNATYHQRNYTQLNPPLQVSLISNLGENLTVIPDQQYPDVGLYTFTFTVYNFYDNITLNLKVFTQGSYKHIVNSPFNLTMVQRDPLLLCSNENILVSGYGITSASYITSQPNVVTAGQQFTIQLTGINIYKTIYQVTADPIQMLYTLDYAINSCICSNTSTFCHHFSGSYQQCSQNKQCRWDHQSANTIGAHLHSCKPCTSPCQPPTYVKTTDSVYTYFATSIQKIGTHATQLNVLSQGNLKLLMYERNDWSLYSSQTTIYDFRNIKFDQNLNNFFNQKRQQWSAAFLGQLRFTTQKCTYLIDNKLGIQQNSEVLVTWTLETDLRAEVYIDNNLMLNKTANEKSGQLFKWCTQNQLMLFEIRVAFDEPLPNKSRGYLKVFQETFDTPRLPILPMNLFHFLPIDTTLNKLITVLPDVPSAKISQLFVSNCQPQLPYSSNILVKVKDQFGNQMNLAQNDVLLINIKQNNNTVIQSKTLQQNSSSLDYFSTIGLVTAYNNYYIYATLNGIEIPNTSCNITKMLPDVSQPKTSLVQVSFCPAIPKVPYNSTVTVKVMDQFSNQKNLSAQDNLLVNIKQDGDLIVFSKYPQQNSSTTSMDYLMPIVLLQAYHNYYIYATLNGVEIPNTSCNISTVLPDAVSAQRSQLTISQCSSTFMLPYNVTAVIRALDQFGNQRNLSSSDILLVNIKQDSNLIIFSNPPQQNRSSTSMDYLMPIVLMQAYRSYYIYATLNGVEIPNTPCNIINMKPGEISVDKSKLLFTNCPATAQIPFNSTVIIKALDMYGNQRSLSTTDKLLVNIKIDGIQLLQSSAPSQNSSSTSMDYFLNFSLEIAFHRYQIYATLNGVEIPNYPCEIYTIDTKITIN